MTRVECPGFLQSPRHEERPPPTRRGPECILGRSRVSVCETAGIGRRTPHDLRRSAASFLASQGVELPVTMAICGWSSSQVAIEVYQRASDEGLEAAAAALNDLLGR